MTNTPPSTARVGTRVWRILAVLLVLLALGLRVPLARHRFFDPDEFQHLHGAYCIAHGMVPYRDYFEHHTPWLHYGLRWLLPLQTPTVATIFAARYLMLAGTALILLFTFLLGRQLYNADVGLLAALLLSYLLMFLAKTLEIRPDVPAVICWLAALWLLVRGIQTDQRRAFLLSGLAMGSAIMFTPKALFGMAGLFAVLAWLHIDYRFDQPWRHQARLTLSFLVGLAIPIGVTMLFFLCHHGLWPFVYDNFLLNAHWKAKFWPYTYIRTFIRENPFCVVLGMTGWLAGLLGLWRWENIRRGAIVPAAATTSVLIGLYVIPVPYQQYYQLLLPLWALGAAWLLWRAVRMPGGRELLAKWKLPPQRTFILLWIVALFFIAWALKASLHYSKPTLHGSAANYWWLWGCLALAMPTAWLPRGWQRSLALALIGLAAFVITPLHALGPCYLIPAVMLVAAVWFLPPRLEVLTLVLIGMLAFPFQQMINQLGNRNDGQLREIQYVLDHSNPDEAVMDGFRGTGVFRPHAYFYWFLHHEIPLLLTDKQLGEDIVQALATRKPKFVINDEIIRAQHAVVREYIRQHYEPTGVGPILQRKD